jgi:predicted Zn-dependent peptidase
MSSRLFLSLRERLGLAYDVHAYASNLLDTGAISIYLAVDPENADKALRATLDEVKQLRDGLSPPELHKILEYSKGRMLLSMEETRSVSAWYGGQALLRGTTRSVDDVVQELEAVREEDIVRVAEQLITDDSLRLAVVGPFDDADRFEQTLHL